MHPANVQHQDPTHELAARHQDGQLHVQGVPQAQAQVPLPGVQVLVNSFDCANFAQHMPSNYPATSEGSDFKERSTSKINNYWREEGLTSTG